jgi:hypothetical protein
MGASRRNLQAQTKILKTLTEHQIYQPKRKFTLKKYVSYFKSVKEPKIRMRATRRNLQVQPKILKKSSKHQIRTKIFPKINQSEQKFSQQK